MHEQMTLKKKNNVMKKLTLIFTTTLLMCACSPSRYYQLYKVSTNGLEQTKDQLIFENEHCIVAYNLWGENGDLSFTLFNKTDKDLFVVMPQSFFIRNGVAHDYYTNAIRASREVTQMGKAATIANSYATGNGYGVWGAGKSATYTRTSTSENSTITKETEVVCIPPRAKKLFDGFSLVEDVHKDCDDYDFNYPEISSDIITFDKESSPWDFRNRIAYTFDIDDTDRLYIENELWVSYMQNHSSKVMEEQIMVTPCEMNVFRMETIILNKAPNAFYNKYTKTLGATKLGTSIGKEDKNEVYSTY